MAIQQTFDFLALDEPAILPGGRGSVRATKRGSGKVSGRTQALRRRNGETGPEGSRPTAKNSLLSDPKSATALPSREDHPGSAGALPSLDELRAKARCIHVERSTDDSKIFSTGSPAIDSLLPRGGLPVGTITEWVAQADGCGAAALSMIAAATHLQSSQTLGPLVVVSGAEHFYPPAVVALGIPVDRVIWVRPKRHADTVWAIDQALRSEATAIVWAPIGVRLDDRDARRFQLAAEIGNTPGLFLRPIAVRGCPTFADIRFHVGNEVKASSRAMRVTLDRCRGGQIGHSVAVQINDRAGIDPITLSREEIDRNETTPLHLASQLAHPQRNSKQRTA